VQRPGTVGLPYDGVQSRLDPANGEIQMKSAGLMLGYYKEPELTPRALTDDGWLHTGDKGALDAEGNLKITGRVKDLFKTSKGKYVAPGADRGPLVMHAAIEACCVTGANLGQPLAHGDAQPRGPCQGATTPIGRTELEAVAERPPEAHQRHARPARAARLPGRGDRALDVDNGFITPTFKVKRNRIEEVYAAHYERWVGMRKKVIWSAPRSG
jgi:long-chain acyl-CoA synthetase